MSRQHKRSAGGWTALAASVSLGIGVALGQAALAAELPKATQKMLSELKLVGDPIVADLESEAENAPAAMVEASRKEGALELSGSMHDEDFKKIIAPFRERYPWINFKYVSGDTNMRTIKPLLAFRQGKILDDIVEGLGNNISEYRAAGALQKIDDLPNYKNVPVDIQDPEGYWVAPRLRYWCMTYNTNNVKPSDLPKTWDDLLTDKALYNGRVGLVNRPNNFMIMLWGAKGPDWSANFIDKLFNVVKPQFRTEGSDAVVDLVAAGEIDVSIPTADYRTFDTRNKGAPVSWHCPEPVPLSFSAMAVIANSPHSNAARLYVNWFLGKEGQIAQYYGEQSPPTHKGLQDPRFLVYPDQILGHKMAPRYPKLLQDDMSTVQKLWDKQWQKSSSAAP